MSFSGSDTIKSLGRCRDRDRGQVNVAQLPIVLVDDGRRIRHHLRKFPLASGFSVITDREHVVLNRADVGQIDFPVGPCPSGNW